jgi:hypothetical protein
MVPLCRREVPLRRTQAPLRPSSNPTHDQPLDIVFNPGAKITPPVVTVVALENPGFELGAQGWTATAGVIATESNEPDRTGTGKVWLGGYGTPHTETLSQRVTLPTAGPTRWSSIRTSRPKKSSTKPAIADGAGQGARRLGERFIIESS